MIKWILLTLLFLDPAAALSAEEPPPLFDLSQTSKPSPDGEVIATVLGEPITRNQLVAVETEYNRERMTPEEFAQWETSSQNRRLLRLIRGPLVKDYAHCNELSPTEAERQAVAKRTAKTMGEQLEKRGEDPNSAEGQKQIAMQIWWQTSAYADIKIARALHAEYGGAIGLGSLGMCVAIDGQVALFKAEAEQGRLAFRDPLLEERFWQTAANRRQADAVLDEPERIEAWFETIDKLYSKQPSSAQPSSSPAN